MSGTDGLAEFLADRYDEAEAQVNDRLCIHCGIPTCELRHDLGVYDYTHGTSPDWRGWQGRRCPGKLTGAEPVQNRAHRLADIALKRAILADVARICEVSNDLGAFRLAVRTMRQLGTEFASHPGYRSEWAP